MSIHPLELISAYADSELSAEEAARVRAHLDVCTECSRELALIRSIGETMMQSTKVKSDTSVWRTVNRRIATPVGWLLMITGVVIWISLAVAQWIAQRALTWEWLATTAVAIGVALLAVGVGYEQYVEWRESPYKDLER